VFPSVLSIRRWEAGAGFEPSGGALPNKFAWRIGFVKKGVVKILKASALTSVIH